MRKYLNESLPKEQRLGQVGLSRKYGEMKIVAYRSAKDIDMYFKNYDCIVKNKAYGKFLLGSISLNHKEMRIGEIRLSDKNEEMILIQYRNANDVDVMFLHNWQVIKTSYQSFFNGEVGNPLYNKERYKNQIRLNKDEEWMKLLTYNSHDDCVVEFEDGKQTKCKWWCFNKGEVKHPKNERKNLKKIRTFQVIKNRLGEEIMVLNYKKEKNIDIIFLHNWEIVKSSYNHFLKGNIKNPLYYKERYEGQVRKANNGQLMKLLIYNDAMNCVVEFEDRTLVDCLLQRFLLGQVANPNYIKPSENEFYFNNDLNCWVGVTNKGEEFLFNHPNENVVEEVKKYTWHINKHRYVNSSKNKRLHHIIKPIPNDLKDKYDRIDHIDNNPLNNRYENLRYSNAKLNARNIKSVGESGITGLIFSKQRNTWVGRFNNIQTKHRKEKQEALIDLLIMQRYLNVAHNEHLFYLLDNVAQKKIDEVIQNIERQIEKHKNRIFKVTCRNTFEKIDDETYKMYDSKGKWCLIDVEDIEKIKLGSWSCQVVNNKEYFNGRVIINDYIIKKRLHKYILNLTDKEYSKNFIIDHLDGNSLNNRKENLVITDIKGNNINVKSKFFRNDKCGGFNSRIKVNKKEISRTFNTEKKSIEFHKFIKNILMNGRLQWKSKEELDEWIKDIESNELTINEAINQHYKNLYKNVVELIKKEYPGKKIK